MSQKRIEPVPSPSGEDRVMNDTLSDYMSARSDKITVISRESIIENGETIHRWLVTIEIE